MTSGVGSGVSRSAGRIGTACTRCTGLLDPETGALLRAALEPLAGPRHTAQERDMRTVSQRMHDAVRDAAKLMLASGDLPSQAGVPATLFITAKLDDLERRTGHVSTAHGGLLPIRDVLRLAANARLVPAVFDTDGAPLWLGQSQRLASKPQRPHPHRHGQGLRLPRLRRARDPV